MEVPIDPRVHRRLIGTKGRTIRKFMDTYKVDIRFPSLNTSDPVVISGTAENVEEAKDQLLLLEEEYVSVYFRVMPVTCARYFIGQFFFRIISGTYLNLSASFST